MSDTDDRMDRAERIRRMRESREPGDDHETADTADANDAADADDSADDGDAAVEDETAGGEAVTMDADSGATDDSGAAEDGAKSGASNGDDPTQPETSAANVTDSAESSVASDDTQHLMTGPGPVDRQPAEVTAQASSADTDAVGAQPATSAEPDGPTNAGNQSQAAAGPADGETATSEPVAPLGGDAGFSLPGAEELEAAADATETGVDEEAMTAGAARARGTTATATEPTVRVLEFTVGDQIYCIDIEEVEEIVKRESVTRVPNTEAYVEGVVDLRGQITTILDTKQLLDVAADGPESLLVIFAPDAFEEHGTVGWVVDEVRQVVPVMESQVRAAPTNEEYVRGVVDREDEDDLVVWIRPGDAMESAVAVEADD